MTTSQLKTFLSVCHYLSFTEASVSLGLTSSAVSRQISTLEEEIGIRLFTRKNNAILLTPAGIHFRAEISRICGDLEQAIHETAKLELGISGELRIGVLSDQTVEEPICDILCQLSTEDNITVKLRRMNFRELYEQIESRQIDAAITIIQSRHFFSDWNKYIYAIEPVRYALHRRFAESIHSPVKQEDLERISPVPMAVPSLSSFVESQQSFLRSLDSFRSAQMQLEIDSIIPMTLAGLCGALVNTSNVLFCWPEIVKIDVENLPSIEKGILWRSDNENPILSRFIENLRSVFMPNDSSGDPAAV